MQPEIIVSSRDLDALEGLLSAPAARGRGDLDGLRDELARAEIREVADMPEDVIAMNSRARFREEHTGREYEMTLAYPRDASPDLGRVSIFSPAGSALLGLKAGQTINWQTSERNTIELTVLSVQPGQAD